MTYVVGCFFYYSIKLCLLFIQVSCLQDHATSLLQKTWNVSGDYLNWYKTSQISHFIHHSKGNLILYRNICLKCIFKDCHWINLRLKFKKVPFRRPKNSRKFEKLWMIQTKIFSDYRLAPIPHEFFVNTPGNSFFLIDPGIPTFFFQYPWKVHVFLMLPYYLVSLTL